MPESPTLALRKQIIAKGPLSMDDKYVIIGDTSYSPYDKTTYTNRRDQPYTIGSIFYLYTTREMDHGDYISECRAKQIEPVSFLDREWILEDLLSPLPLDKINIIKPARIYSIDINRVISEYDKLKKIEPTGIQCILLPRDDSDITNTVFKGIDRNGFVKYIDRTYRIIHSPFDVDSVERIAAVFIDGSTWQFNEWPRELTDRMKYIPVFYLSTEGSSSLPALVFPVTVLRADESSESSSNERTSGTFWSIMGAQFVSNN